MNSDDQSRCPVSVVIPMYRAEPVIEKTIEHLCRQTCLPEEVLFVDDESPDRAAEIVERFLATNPPFRAELIRQKNGGPAKARNAGIRAARAPFVAFLDQDDLWFPDKLSRCWQVLKQLGPEYVGVYHTYQLSYPDGRIVPGPSLRPEDLDYEVFVRYGNQITNSTVIARRSVIEHAGYLDEAPGLIAVEDFDLWMRLAAVGKWKPIHESLMTYTAGVGFSWKNFHRQRVHLSNLMLKHMRGGFGPISMSLRLQLLGRAIRYRIQANYLRFKEFAKQCLKPLLRRPSAR